MNPTCRSSDSLTMVSRALQTKLRHVDIHNHWVRQEVQSQTIVVQYTLSNHMIADGFTKALTKDELERFKQEVGLLDISDRFPRMSSNEPTYRKAVGRVRQLYKNFIVQLVSRARFHALHCRCRTDMRFMKHSREYLLAAIEGTTGLQK
jgi:hypothetical protein